jgi:hypothetical protein
MLCLLSPGAGEEGIPDQPTMGRDVRGMPQVDQGKSRCAREQDFA